MNDLPQSPPPRLRSKRAVIESLLLKSTDALKTRYPTHATTILRELEHAVATATHELDNQQTHSFFNLKKSEAESAYSSASVSKSEHAEVFLKLAEITSTQELSVDEEAWLYLEQQLADIVGFEIARNLAGYELPNLRVRMAAALHAPTTQNIPAGVAQDLWPEVPVAAHRSWYAPPPNLSPQQWQLANRYQISLPLHTLSEWQNNPSTTSQWFAWRKILVVNPLEQIALVTVVGDIYRQPLTQFQAAASPAIVREGRVWSFQTQGIVLMLFIHDPTDSVPLGPVSLAWESYS
jgi:hypothetical protein